MGVRNRPRRRTPLQVAADDSSGIVQAGLGRMLRDGRKRRGLTQASAASIAGISRSEWSGLERGKKVATLWIVSRAAYAVGGRLKAYIEQTSAADAPRDAVHLKGQELILRTALAGGWSGLPEVRLDAEAGRSRYADVILERRRAGAPREVALMELIDWFDDVGAPTRAWQGRLEALERQQIARMVGDEPVPRISGCWVVRATRRNRELVGQHSTFFGTRFPGSGRAWLRTLADAAAPMPMGAGLLWISVGGERLFAARLGNGR